MKKIKDQSGFTLLELLIVVTIMVGIMGSIFAFMQQSWGVSKGITDFSDLHNIELTTNQFIRATLANATYMEMVDTCEAMENPEEGYSYLYCGSHGGLTLYDGNTHQKTELYTTKTLNRRKLFVLFKPNDEKVSSVNISESVISGDLDGENVTPAGYITETTGGANASNLNVVTVSTPGVYNDFTRPKGYGSLSVTMKMVSFSKDAQTNYDAMYDHTVDNAIPSGDSFQPLWYLDYIYDQCDGGAYNIFMDRIFNGLYYKSNTQPMHDSVRKYFAVSDSFETEISFHNAGCIFVQNTHFDTTTGTRKLVRKYTGGTNESGDKNGLGLQSQLYSNLPNVPVRDYDGTILRYERLHDSDPHKEGKATKEQQINCRGYGRCIKFQKPDVGELGTVADGDVEFKDFTVTKGTIEAGKQSYKLSFTAYNTADHAIIHKWSFPQSPKLGDLSELEIGDSTATPGMVVTKSGTKLLKFSADETSNGISLSSFGAAGTPEATKTLEVTVYLPYYPELTESDCSFAFFNGGHFIQMTLTNPVSGKKVYTKAKVTFPTLPGKEFTYEGTVETLGTMDNYSWLSDDDVAAVNLSDFDVEFTETKYLDIS